MNAKASQTERVLGRRIMTRCHAFWSFGTVAGALIGGAFARAGDRFLTQQLIAAAGLRRGDDLLRAAAASPTTRRRRAPSRGERASGCPRWRCSPMCLVPIGALLIEGAMMEWSALLMREWKGAGPFVTALTFSVFALAMAVARLTGDWLAERFGPRPVILASGLAMAVGIVAFGLAPGLWLSLPAALLVGRGLRQHLSADHVHGRAAAGAAAGAERGDAGAGRLHRLPDRAAADRDAGARSSGCRWRWRSSRRSGSRRWRWCRGRRGGASAAVDAGDGVGLVDLDVHPVLAEVHGGRRGREEHAGPLGQVHVVERHRRAGRPSPGARRRGRRPPRPARLAPRLHLGAGAEGEDEDDAEASGSGAGMGGLRGKGGGRRQARRAQALARVGHTPGAQCATLAKFGAMKAMTDSKVRPSRA